MTDIPKARNKCQVQVEDILQPFYRRGGLVGEDFDEVRSGFVTSRLECIFVELPDAVGDLLIDLRSSQGAIDTGCGLG